jgi:hypothetical protein
MTISSLSLSAPPPHEMASTLQNVREAPQPRPAPEKRDLRAEWRAAHPTMSPQQAIASNAELGPPTDNPRADNHGSKIHTEIKVNGKVIARAYNGGGLEIADEYRFLVDEMSFGADKTVGPDLAKDRVQRIMAVLQRYGAVIGDEAKPQDLLSAKLAKQPIVDAVLAATAQTQAQWLDDMAKEGRLPGSLFSGTA